MSKIIIFGLGRGQKYIEKKLKINHEVVGYADSCSKISIFYEQPFYKEKELPEVMKDVDYLVISLTNKKESLSKRDMLANEIGMPKRCIIPFYSWIDTQNWKYLLEKVDINNVPGIILGNSVAYYGIDTDFISRGFTNFSLPCQDIYFNYLILMAVLKEKPNLEYLWIDLFDYNYFNVDMSLTCNTLNRYISMGGILDEHNFSRNKAYNYSFEELLFEIHGISGLDKESRDTMSYLFEPANEYEFRAQREIYDTMPDVSYIYTAFFSDSLYTRREETVRENEALFWKILDEAKRYNPNIKIILTLLPYHKSLEKARRFPLEMMGWKQHFLSIIDKAVSEYGCFFLDYKDKEEISSNGDFYFEAQHMNAVGAKCMTSIIDSDLYRLNTW